MKPWKTLEPGTTMAKEQLEAVLHGLGDANRRRILDILSSNPGLNVSELSEHFEVTRYAVMKHLNVLEEAELVVSEKKGRSRHLYFNAMPLQVIYERWMSEFSSLVGGRLSRLERHLDDESPPEHTFESYIRTTPARLWEALIEPDKTRAYYFGTAVDSTFEPGGPIAYVGRESTVIEGEVLEAEPPSRLVHTFRFGAFDDPESRVTYDIEPVNDDVVRVTLTHDELVADSRTYREVGQGWPRLIAGLKSLLETGRALAF